MKTLVRRFAISISFAAMARVSWSRPAPNSILSAALSLVLCAGGASIPTTATAAAPDDKPAGDATSDRHAEGVRLYEDGTAKYDTGEYAAAIESFKASFDLLGDPLLLYNLAICYDRLDDLDASLEYFKRYRGVAPASEYAAIDRKIASVEARKAARSSKAPADDRGDSRSRPSQRADVIGPDEPSPRTKTKVFTPTVWGLTGASVAVLGLGVGLAVASVRRDRRAEDSCAEQGGVRLCDASGSDDLAKGRTLGIVGVTALAVGGALAVAAIAVIATNASRGRRGQRSGNQARIIPTPLGLVGRF